MPTSDIYIGTHKIRKDVYMSENNELRLSVSKVKVYSQCQKKYFYQYIAKMPMRDEEGFFILGKLCHKALELFHLHYINFPLSKDPYNKIMGKAFKDACLDAKNELTKEIKSDAYRMIDKYLKSISTNKKNNKIANVLFAEKQFSIPIANDVLLSGIIDRVDFDDDQVYHILDYKTTKEKRYLENDLLQLKCYSYVLLYQQPELKKIRCSYYLLKHGELITKEFYPEEILKVKDVFIDYASRIRAETEYKPNPNFLCRYCPFLDSCNEGKDKVSPQLKYGEIDY